MKLSSLLLSLFWFTKNYSPLGWKNKKLSYLRLIQTFISLPLKFKLQRLYHITRHNFFISIKNEIFLEKLEKTFHLNSFELQSYRPTKCFILGLSLTTSNAACSNFLLFYWRKKLNNSKIKMIQSKTSMSVSTSYCLNFHIITYNL